MKTKNNPGKILSVIVLLFFFFLSGGSCKKKIDEPPVETEEEILQTPWVYDTPWPFDQPSTASLRASEKKVFAHYFTQFPTSIDNKPAASDYYQNGYLNPNGESGKHLAYGGYLRNRPLPRSPRPVNNWMELDMQEEVRQAIALGLDGFACDLLSEQGYHFDRVIMLLEAAHQIDPDFKIMLMPDMEAFQSKTEKIASLVKTLAAYPSAYHLPDGRLVVSPFNSQNESAEWWKTWLANMKTDGIDIAFVPLFQSWKNYAPEFAPISYGMSDWGWRSVNSQSSWSYVPAQAQAYGPIWMMPVAPQDMRPKSQTYSEAGNSGEYRVMWENAIMGGADWVQLITWNDYSEHTCIEPSTGTQYSFYDLTAYYTTWFKTGVKPEIKRDVLYYFYRKHATTAPHQQVMPFARAAGTDAPLNEIELLAFLVQPGTLEIVIDGKISKKDVPAGMSSFKIPMHSGRPVFYLIRNGKAEITLPGAFTIKDKTDYQNLLYYGGSNSRMPELTAN